MKNQKEPDSKRPVIPKGPIKANESLLKNDRTRQ